jgi:hypothetical protein
VTLQVPPIQTNYDDGIMCESEVMENADVSMNINDQQAGTGDNGCPENAIHSPSLGSTSAGVRDTGDNDFDDDDSDNDDSDNDDSDVYEPIYRFYCNAYRRILPTPEGYGNYIANLELVSGLHILKYHPILKGEGQNGQDFSQIMNELDVNVWEPARRFEREMGLPDKRQLGPSFEDAYQECISNEYNEPMIYSNSTEESREEWKEVNWYAWFIREGLEKLWLRRDGLLWHRDLRPKQAAYMLWYLMQQWSANNLRSPYGM